MITYFYSGSTRGFYNSDIHGTNIPPDAIPLTSVDYTALIEAQSAGKIITVADGVPVAQDPPPPSHEEQIKVQIAQIENTITQRRLREALLSSDGAEWLDAQDKKIADLRAQLVA